MKPTFFPQSNITLHKPESMTDEECMEIKVYKDPNQIISCWQPTPEERVKLAMGGTVWLYIFGTVHPPVFVTADNPWTEE